VLGGELVTSGRLESGGGQYLRIGTVPPVLIPAAPPAGALARTTSAIPGGSARPLGDARVIEDEAALVVTERTGEAEGGRGVAVPLLPGLVRQPGVALV